MAAALWLVGWRAYWRLQASLPDPGRYGAVWASRQDVRDLVVHTGTNLTGRIVLGAPHGGRRSPPPCCCLDQPCPARR